MNMLDKVRATDPYPPSRVALDLDAEGRELMEEIMTPKKTLLSRHPLGRHGRWVVPVAAAAAVAAVAVGGVVIRGGDDGADPSNSGAASSGQAHPSKSTQKPAQPKSDPGLPPSPENLYHVVHNDDAWKVDSLDNDPVYGGSLSWTNDKLRMEMTWYQAEDYQMYLRDRRTGGPGSKVTILGQEGEAFTKSFDDLPLPKDGATIYATDGPEMSAEPTNDPNVPDLYGGLTILPPVGDWFLEFSAAAGSRAEYNAMIAGLTRVDRDAWLAAMSGQVVRPADGAAFLDEAGRGVPLPDGVTVTEADLSLPQSPYQARTSFVSKVLCGWAKQYAGGDDAALDALRGSKDWAVLKAMDEEGDYPEVTEENVKLLAADRTDDGWRSGWGCP